MGRTVRLLATAILLTAGCTGTWHREGAPRPVAASAPPAPAPERSEGLGRLTSFNFFGKGDPAAVRLDVRALPCSNAVRSPCVLVASVIDAQGKPLQGRRVDWLLEGVGHILAVDDRGVLPGRGKVDSRSAVSFTGDGGPQSG